MPAQVGFAWNVPYEICKFAKTCDTPSRLPTLLNKMDEEAKDALPWAQAVIKNLEAGGIKDAKIIYPAKKN